MKILIFRKGAFGDVIVTTPLIRYLHSKGHEIYYIANERGVQVLRNNPYITKLIEDKTDSVPSDQLPKLMQYHADRNNCKKILDLSESIEVALSQHPRSSGYKLPRLEKLRRFNRNYYEYTFEFADRIIHECMGDDWKKEDVNERREFLKPELFFTDIEREDASKYMKPYSFNILIGMSGSGTNKAYPWTEHVAHTICEELKDVHITTVGDERCQMIEPILKDRITNLSGKISMRTSMALCGLVDLILSPDTGLLHSSGAYSTPKIGLLGHNTREVITKHFMNDYSIEADPELAECAPCLSLIYNMKLQCPIDLSTGGCMCMSKAIKPELVIERIREVYVRSKEK